MMSSEVLTAKYFTSVNGRSVFVLHFYCSSQSCVIYIFDVLVCV